MHFGNALPKRNGRSVVADPNSVFRGERQYHGKQFTAHNEFFIVDAKRYRSGLRPPRHYVDTPFEPAALRSKSYGISD